METAAAALPDDLLADVLGRLPARSLATTSRRVCKAWHDLIDKHKLLLRFLLPVRGLFINYQDYNRRSHFFSRPTSTSMSSPAHHGRCHIDGRFDFVQRERAQTKYRVQDHCNGLVLLLENEDDVLHVCNPTTRWSTRLPPCHGFKYYNLFYGECRAFLVFDPFVSLSEYKVLLSPEETGWKLVGKDDAGGMEWPPSAWATWHEFTSSTGKWVKKVFVREGEAAGTAGDLLLNSGAVYSVQRWRYAAYWQGALYVHCLGEYVSRFSLPDDKYRVIKSPIQLAESKNNHGVWSFLGRSEKGVYIAAIASGYIATKLRVWTLTESNGHMEWVPKDESNLKINTYSWPMENSKLIDPKYWILDNDNGTKNQDISAHKQNYLSNVIFLGFHPNKEVIFLCCKSEAVAFHLNTPKVQYLGKLHLSGTYNHGIRESFVYAPCLIGD